MKNIKVTDYCSHIMDLQVKNGDICVDATMGNGYDTLHLAELVGDNGCVHAFDIQEVAIDTTYNRLANANLKDRARLYLDSHENLLNYVGAGRVSCIVFNLGYLPGGNHSIATRADSSIRALNCALNALKQEGVLIVSVYSGGDSGFEERDAVLDFIANLDSKSYLAIKTEFYNRSNNPPIPLIVVKL